MSPRQLVRLFNQNVFEDFQKKTLHLLMQTYWRAFQRVASEYETPEREYLLGHERRSMFDRDWRKLADGYEDEDISAEVGVNANGSFKFTKVTAGRIVMTAATVGEDLDLVRKAVFRNSLSIDSQRFLFGDESAEDSRIYSLLIHAPSRDSGFTVPSSARIIFPLPSGKRHEASIDLIERFAPDMSAPPDEETISDDLHPELRDGDDQVHDDEHGEEHDGSQGSDDNSEEKEEPA